MIKIKTADVHGTRVLFTLVGVTWLLLMGVSVVAIVVDDDWRPAIVIWGGHVVFAVAAGLYKLSGKIFVSR